MGGSTASPKDWDKATTRAFTGKAATGAGGIFHRTSSTGIHASLDPKTIVLRESRDSDANPNSTPIIVCLDVTGSMGHIAQHIATDGLKTLFTEIYDRKPVSDPHIMFMGVGDVAANDRAPLQVSQFESDIVLVDQLQNIWLEFGGGGNASESYTLPWWFAAMRTSTDAYEKRGKKGYLFTIGDDGPPAVVTAAEFEAVFGPGEWTDMTSQQLLDMASKQYNVYHLMVERGGTHRESFVQRWADLLGQRAIRLSDYSKLSEVIVSIIQVNEGLDAAAVAATWDGTTSLVVAKAVGGLVASKAGATGSVVEF